MRACPQTRTPELLGELAGADNAWTVYFAASEITDFSPAARGGRVGDDVATVADSVLSVQPAHQAFQPGAASPQQPHRHQDIQRSAGDGVVGGRHGVQSGPIAVVGKGQGA